MLPKTLSYLSFVILILISFATVADRQNQPSGGQQIHIHVHADNTISVIEYNLDVLKSAHYIKLVYAFYDSLNTFALHQDTTFQRLNAEDIQLRKAGDEAKRYILWKTLGSIYRKYEVYNKDSIQLKSNTDTAYFSLINPLIAMPNLEYLKGTKNRQVLDRTLVSINIINAHGTQSVTVASPTQSTNPLLCQVLTQTLNQFRKHRKNLILDTHRTGGY